MKPTGRMRLAADVRDLQIVDSQGGYCGIVDDIELDGKAGEALRPVALLVGPGAYRHRLGRIPLAIVHWIAGDRVVRVPWDEIEHITSVVTLRRTARELGLAKSEDRARKLLPRIGAMDEAV
jgi:sporulation protein YlmC with PRC-barrel domain